MGLLGDPFNVLFTSPTIFERPRGAYFSPSVVAGRLFYYQNITHNDNRYIIGESTTLTIIGTLGKTSRSAYAAPFPASGVAGEDYQTEAPLFFTAGGWAIGGWGLRDSWWRPTEDNLQTIFERTIQAIGQPPLPAAGQPHGLLVYLRFRRHYKASSDDADSGVTLMAVHPIT